MLAPAVVFVQALAALHVICVVGAFGVPFAFPLLAMAVEKTNPEAIPALYRARVFAGRAIVNPGLLLVLAFGLWAAAKLSAFHQFYVQWGIAAVIVIGGLEGAVVMRGCKQVAASADPSAPQTRAARRQVDLASWAIVLIVVVTIYLMAVQA